jgi:hypothetical protein
VGVYFFATNPCFTGRHAGMHRNRVYFCAFVYWNTPGKLRVLDAFVMELAFFVAALDKR